MKWDNDPYRYEKHIIMDAIIKFSEAIHERDISTITIKDLTDFIDKFMVWEDYGK